SGRGPRLRAPSAIDAVVPARNEAPTVQAVVAACRGCSFVRRVIVVDDGSTDATAALASAAGARVVHRPGGAGSKALAMQAGVEASDAEAILFVDADLVGLTSAHLDALCAPYLDGRATMSFGIFDYGIWNGLVLRFPPTSGERLIPRWVFEAVPPAKRDGYLIEIMINEVVTEARLPIAARVMAGVTHRTKRDKFGRVEGYRRTWRMFRELMALWGVCRWRTYWYYLRDLTVE
ncbi:MAG: glycosyltransferase family 2 protein, partial [Acidimicrobiales bacterium]